MRVVLTVLDGPNKGKAFQFEGHDNFLVGRANDAHFRLPDDDNNVSRVHFMVEVNPPQCQLLDMRSRNGTYVNEQRVTTAVLKDGDRIRAGNTTLGVSFQDVAGVSPPAHPAAAREGKVKYVSPRQAPPPPPQTIGKYCVVCGAPAVPVPDRANPLLSYLCPACRKEALQQAQPIEGYQIVRELGRGGMGVIYLALRSANGVLTALKTFKLAMDGTEAQVQKFIREASILCNLEHPNIVGYREMGEAKDGTLYFAMDYVRGTDAGCLLKEHGPMPVVRAVGLTCQLLEALAYAHGQGFVHRDIKPANLLVTKASGPSASPAEMVKLADFGLARTYQTSELSGLSITGQFSGSVQFMAPEQITNFRESKPPVDQYAAAATLYTLLTNSCIYDFGEGPHSRYLMILIDDPVPIQSRRKDVPAGLAEIIHRALARDPGKRFADVQEMHKALGKFSS
jgi:serine/threonine-protein kinase